MTENEKQRRRRVLAFKEKMNTISPTLCMAKWLQTTLHLHNGHTHSCHHPQTHQIPLEEIENNPSALHNTEHKKHQRRLMLKGKQPSECNYCWKIENMKKGHLSDRMTKSASSWSAPHFEKVMEAKDTGDIKPTYLEVSFDPICNFKCAYCSPEFSSKWGEEIKQFGEYPTTQPLPIERKSIPNREHNPYIEAFWKWFPDIQDTLETFRITGGEPLLSKHTWRVLDMIVDKPNPECKVAINSNLGVPDRHMDRLIEYADKLKGKVKEFNVFTSCEAVGKDAEYIRFGMNYEKFTQNVRRVLVETHATLTFMITFNNLSVPSFEQFLDYIRELRQEGYQKRIILSINYINHPRYMCVRILPDEIKKKFTDDMKRYFSDKTADSNRLGFFTMEEIEQVMRICNYMFTEDPDLDRNRMNFYRFFTEYDRRRKTNFHDVFPTLSEFMDSCTT